MAMTAVTHHDVGIAPTTPTPLPFGKYMLLERIAVGGMAEVWLGRAVEPGRISRLLAIKKLLPSFSEDDEFVEMFMDEAWIAGQLDHPGIVQIGELGRVDSSYYIAMEFVWGRDLLGIMQRLHSLRRSLEPTFAAYIAARMCESLHIAHTARDKAGRPLEIVHRDVSPQNVIVSFDGEVKLIDFGIAMASSRTTHTQAGTRKGKFGYMSPEQVRGSAVDHRSDQFAVGTVLYEMLTGRPLFPRANDYATLSLVREAEIPPLREHAAECPPELIDVVTRLLAKRPEDRFATAHEAGMALDRIVAQLDPAFERFALLSWMRALFGKEMRAEKARLEALERVPHARFAEPMATTELGSDDDDEADTRVFAQVPTSASGAPASMDTQTLDDRRGIGRREIFFRRELASEPESSGTARPFASEVLSARTMRSAPESVNFGDIGPYPGPEKRAQQLHSTPASEMPERAHDSESPDLAAFSRARERTPNDRQWLTSRSILVTMIVALPIIGLILIAISILK